MVQSRTNTRLITHALIKAIGLVGAAGAVIIAPNAAQLFDKLLTRYDQKSAAKTLASLKYRQLIEVRKVSGQLEYRLTARGWDMFERIQIKDLTIETPTRWDHRWRVVAFDLPAEYGAQRRQMLKQLHRLEFYKLQDSLWVHPFDCEKQIGVLLSYLRIEQFVTFMVVEQGNFVDKAEKYFIERKKLM